MKIRYVIFDVGGVCYPYSLDKLNQYFREKVTDKNDFDSKKGIKSFNYNPFMAGEVNFTQFCKELCNHCKISSSQDMEEKIDVAMHNGVGSINLSLQPSSVFSYLKLVFTLISPNFSI